MVGIAAASESSGPGNDPTTTGSVEICKAPFATTINENQTPTFTYVLSEGDTTVGTASVTAGTCSEPIAVPVVSSAGTVVTVAEAQAQWFTVSAIASPDSDQNYIVPSSVNLTAGTVDLNVLPSTVSKVQFTNAPDDGFMEVCKSASTGSPLTGDFAFDLAGSNGFTGTATVTAGACSGPIEVPAGDVTVTEGGPNLYVTSISASFNATSGNAIVNDPGAPTPNPNLQSGAVMVSVKPAFGDPSVQTVVNYTDNTVELKVCKVVSGFTAATLPTTPYSFALTATGTTGPATVPASISLSAGLANDTPATAVCSNPPVMLRAGTTVTVTEGITPGTKVDSIVLDGAYSLPTTPVPNPDAVNRTVTFVVGQPVTGVPTSLVNEATVTFTDVPAADGDLKICAFTGMPAPAGTSYSFTVTPSAAATATAATVVPAGQCNFVGGALAPTLFPYNSTVKIAGTNVSPDVATSITATPTFVTESRGATSEPTIVPGSIDLAVPSVQVMMSEQPAAVTEVDFTIAGASTRGSTGAVSTAAIGGSGGGGGGGGGAPGGASPTSTGGNAGGTSDPGNVVSDPSPAVAGPSTSSVSSDDPPGPNVVAGRILAKDKALLVTVDRDISVTRGTLARYRAAWHYASAHHLKSAPRLLAGVERLEARLRALLAWQHRLMLSIGRL